MKIFNMFLNFLAKHGRKKVLIDYYGNEMIRRYFVFYMEKSEKDNRWITKLPNIFIHQFIRLKNPDGAMDHGHPWNFWTYVLSGGYTEFRSGKENILKTGQLSYMSRKDIHQVMEVKPNTTTIFMHGFKRNEWFFKPRECKVLCDTCAKNFGKCYIGNNEFQDLEAYANQFESTRANQWRTPEWFIWSPELEKKMERRRAAVKKLATSMPSTPEDKVKLVLKHSKIKTEDSNVTKLEI